MKKYLCILMFPVLIVFGCGGGGSKSNIKENKTLGKFPAIFVESPKEMEKILEDMRAETQSAKKPEDVVKIRDKYVAKENEAKQRTQQMADAELEKILDRPVPFEVAYDDPEFEIRSAIIDGGETDTGALTITVVVSNKKDKVASMNSKIKYLIVDTEGHTHFGDAIKPFVSNQIITSRTFPNGLQVAAGAACSRQGSW